MVISWVYSVAMMIQHIVAEKEHRLKEVSVCQRDWSTRQRAQRLLGMGANKAKIETLNKHLKYRACIYKNMQYSSVIESLAAFHACQHPPSKSSLLLVMWTNVSQQLDSDGQ